jgi:hypothetical protein
VTEWKVVKVTAEYNWWGTSLKEEREPVHKDVITTECAYYEVTPEMMAFAKSLVPVLAAKDSTKTIEMGLPYRRKLIPETVSMEYLNSLEKDQSIVLRMVITATHDKWFVGWRPIRG